MLGLHKKAVALFVITLAPALAPELFYHPSQELYLDLSSFAVTNHGAYRTCLHCLRCEDSSWILLGVSVHKPSARLKAK